MSFIKLREITVILEILNERRSETIRDIKLAIILRNIKIELKLNILKRSFALIN